MLLQLPSSTVVSFALKHLRGAAHHSSRDGFTGVAKISQTKIMSKLNIRVYNCKNCDARTDTFLCRRIVPYLLRRKRRTITGRCQQPSYLEEFANTTSSDDKSISGDEIDTPPLKRYLLCGTFQRNRSSFEGYLYCEKSGLIKSEEFHEEERRIFCLAAHSYILWISTCFTHRRSATFPPITRT